MAKRDVQLVIRARNEASKTLDQVAASLGKVDKAQEEAGKSAKSTDSNFASLGDEVGKLAAKVEGLKALGAVATELNKVRKSISDMQASLRNTTTDFGKFAIEAAQAAKNVVTLTAESNDLAAAFARQKTETDAARRETLKGTDAVKAQTKAKKELDAVTAKGTDTAAITKATQAYQRASAVVEQNKAAHVALQAELADTSAKLTDVNAKLTASRRQYQQLIGTAEGLAEASTRTNTAIEATQAQLSELDAKAQLSARSLGAVSAAETDLKSAAAQTTTALNSNAQALAAMQRYSKGGNTGFADPKTAATLRDQREQLAAVEGGWKALEAQIREQASAMRGLEAPTEAQVRALKETVAAARQAKTEYLALQAALARTQGSTKSSFLEFTGGANSLRKFADEAKRTPGPPPVSGWKGFFNSIYGDSRKAMSIMQRLRGEVLALATAYVGLYGTINAIGGVITAYQKLEAAQNRLGVVFAQDAAATRKELEFLERQSARLGVEFGTLADQYSKFAIAAKSGNFTAAGTRDIFISVAEAGRVAKLSLEQMGGVFQALEQIISKGKIQSEELRHQLGDRLPGAFSIMAKALGKTTAELDNAMKKGEVLANESNLTKFAQELDRQFGAQLPQALKTTTTLLGKFTNDIFQAQLRVGKGGFIEALDKGLENLDEWFNSREGRDFFLSLGAALGKFVTVLAEVPKYFGVISQAIQLLIAYKVAQFFVGMMGAARNAGIAVAAAGGQVNGFKAAATGAVATVTSLKAAFLTTVAGVSNFTRNITLARAGMLASAGSAGVMKIALLGLNGAAVAATNVFRLLWAAVGGFPGLVITAITFLTSTLLGNWLGGVDDVTSAMDEHERITQAVLTAYDELAGKTDKWAESIKGVNALQAEGDYIKQLELQKKALDDLQQARRRAFVAADFKALIPGAVTDQLRKYSQLSDQAFDPKNIDSYIDSLVDLNNEVQDLDLKKQILDQIALATAYRDSTENVKGAAANAVVLGSTYDGLNMTMAEAVAVQKEHADAADTAAGAMDDASSATEDYQTALEELKDLIPGVSEEMKKLQQYSKLDVASLTAAAAALASGQSIGEAMNLYGQGNRALEISDNKDLFGDLQSASTSLEKSAVVLRNFEGFREEAYNDPKTDRNGNQVGPNIYRAGFGSDTITLADQTVVKITQGMRVSVADANRDLVRRLGEFQSGIVKEIGPERWGQFTKDQQAALTSIAYNYGSLPSRILGAVKTGSNEQIAAAVRSLGDDNGGVNRKRRGTEALILGGSATDVEKEAAAAEKAAEEREKGRQSTKETLELSRQEVLNAGELTDAEKRRLAVRTAVNAAKKDDLNITKDELAEIAQNAGKAWDAENVTKVRAAQAAATKETLADLATENASQELINAGKGRQAAIEAAIREARKDNPRITQQEIAALTELTGKQYDLANAQKDADEAHKKVEEEVNRLLDYRSTLMATMQAQLAQGDTAGAAATKEQLTGINAQLQTAITNAIAMWKAIGGPEADLAIAKLQQTQIEIKGVSTQTTLFGLNTQQWGQVAADFATGLTGVFDKFAQALANGEDAIGALGDAFLQFAAEFLINIGKMIIQQALLNALQGFLGGFGISVPGASIPLGHTGGLVGSKTIGSGNGIRNLTANIPYFHDGGVVGLKPDETMAVLRKNEEVLTENDPRHIFNQGGDSPSAPAQPMSLKIVNSFDAGEVASEGLNTAIGEQALINVVRKNAATFNAILRQ